jgi:hypothetical protein
MHRLAHRGVRSSQATPAAVDKSAERLEHKNSDSPPTAGHRSVSMRPADRSSHGFRILRVAAVRLTMVERRRSVLICRSGDRVGIAATPVLRLIGFDAIKLPFNDWRDR